MQPDDSGSDIRILTKCELRECAHFTERDGVDGGKCKAFPRGIPEEIAQGDNQHVLPFPGDHGIQYERRT